MKNMLYVPLAILLALGFTACNKKEAAAPVAEAQQALVAPGKDDDAGWRKYLPAVAMQNMGAITNNPLLYYLPPESDPEFADKYQRLAEKTTGDIGRGVTPGNMLAFGSSASAKMADLLEASFKDAQPDSLKKVRIVFIGDAADSPRVEAAVKPSGADYVFVEAK